MIIKLTNFLRKVFYDAYIKGTLREHSISNADALLSNKDEIRLILKQALKLVEKKKVNKKRKPK